MRCSSYSLLPVLLILPLTAGGAFAASLRPADRGIAAGVVAYGQKHLDKASGLVKDDLDIPNLAESSIGYVAACFATGQDLPQASQVLGKILSAQRQSGLAAGDFPWDGGPGEGINQDAVLYLTPLLAWLYRDHRSALTADLQARLKRTLELAAGALARMQPPLEEGATYLQRAAALAAVGAVLGSDDSRAAVEEVSAWLQRVRTDGLPDGHSTSLDGVKLVALKWVREFIPASEAEPVEQALLLTSLDLAQRVECEGPYLAGAIATANVNDYLTGSGYAAYVLYTDFGLAKPTGYEPYVMAALLPAWRTPKKIVEVATQSLGGMARTHATGKSLVSETATYIAPGFTLGTMSGEVGSAGIPLLATFAHYTKAPTLYFFCSPLPCHVQSVQDQTTALVNFDFDSIGIPNRLQAYARGVLGSAQDIDEVYCYGTKWNDQPTSLGTGETVALTTRGCYVGFTITRTGQASNARGLDVNPVTLQWSGKGRHGDLYLTIYARQEAYALAFPIDNVRCGFVIEIAPQSAYPSLASFVRYLRAGDVEESIDTTKERIRKDEKPPDPDIIIPKPESKLNMVFHTVVKQTIDYTNGPRKLQLVADLQADRTLKRVVNGKELSDTTLWDSPAFKLQPDADLAAALKPFTP